MARRLAPEEQALWGRVAATVRPFGGRRVPAPTTPPAAPQRAAAPQPLPAPVPLRAPSGPGETLDAGWDRRLRRGLVAPERTIDLHGHSLATAHAALEHGLAQAVAQGVRLLLLVTGRPPRDGREPPIRRGAIRAQVGDWLAGSAWAGRIAAVRNAHPRHGGAGALYVVIRRPR